MTFFDFAAGHPILALLFAGLAFALPIVLAALFVSWRVTRSAKFTAEDRKALTGAATFVRLLCATSRLDTTEAMQHVEVLERMAGQ